MEMLKVDMAYSVRSIFPSIIFNQINQKQEFFKKDTIKGRVKTFLYGLIVNRLELTGFTC